MIYSSKYIEIRHLITNQMRTSATNMSSFLALFPL